MNYGELRTALQTIIERIEVSRERVAVVIRVRHIARFLACDGVQSFDRDGRRSGFHRLNIPWVGVARLERRLRLPITNQGPSGKLDKRLISLIVEARSALVTVHRDPAASTAELARVTADRVEAKGSVER